MWRRAGFGASVGLLAFVGFAVAPASAQQGGEWVRGEARVIGGPHDRYTSSMGSSGGSVSVRIQTSGGDEPGEAVWSVVWEPPPSVLSADQVEPIEVSLTVSSIEYVGTFGFRLSAYVFIGNAQVPWNEFPFVDMQCTVGDCTTTQPNPSVGTVDLSLGTGSSEGQVKTVHYSINDCAAACAVEWDYTWMPADAEVVVPVAPDTQPASDTSNANAVADAEDSGSFESGEADVDAGADEAGSATGEDEGGGGSTGLIAVGVLAGVGVIGGAEAMRRRRRPRHGSGADSQPQGDDDDERREGAVSLELTYPNGRSPKIFTVGWPLGARCTVDGPDGPRDLSDSVRWSGSGTFEPAVGRRSQPKFERSGPQSIVLSVEHDGREVTKAFAVETVSEWYYASVGSLSSVQSDAHGCKACPHPCVGPITTGSPNVLIDGRPAARVGDVGIHAACCGPNIFEIVGGDPSVLIDGRPAARVGSPVDHCGGTGVIDSK